MKTAANYWGHRPSSGSAWQAGSPCSFRVGSVFMGSSRGGRAGRVLLTTGVFPVTCGFRRMAALVVPRPGFTGRGRFSGVRGLVLCWTRPRGCVWLWDRARSRSRGHGCGILELVGWFRVGPASSDYSPPYGLVQGGAIYRSMKVRDDGVVVAAMLRLLNVKRPGPRPSSGLRERPGPRPSQSLPRPGCSSS